MSLPDQSGRVRVALVLDGHQELAVGTIPAEWLPTFAQSWVRLRAAEGLMVWAGDGAVDLDGPAHRLEVHVKRENHAGS